MDNSNETYAYVATLKVALMANTYNRRFLSDKFA